jgi:hypothetical protein
MKKNIFLAVICLAFSSLSWGQHLKITIQGDTASLNNDTVVVYGNSTATMNSPSMNVFNTGIDSLSVYCRRDSLSTPSPFESDNYFCWVLCYGDNITVSPYTEVINRDTASPSAFQGHYTPLGYIASAYIRYTFFLARNHSDSSWVVVQYISTPTGIQSLSTKSLSFSAYPNPAENMVNFNYNLNTGISTANLKIYNMLGECVQTLPLNTAKNKTLLNVQSIPSGVYVCEIEASGCEPAYQKLIVSH